MADIFKLDDWTFTDFPLNLSIKDYELTQKTIKESLKDESNCSVFMSYSKEHSVPGISDIDYVIFTDNLSPSLQKTFFIDSYPTKIREVLYHDSLFIPYSLSKNFTDVLGRMIFNLHLEHGKKIEFSKPDVHSSFFRLIDDHVLHITRSLYTPYFTKKINVRSLLHKLRTIEHLNLSFLHLDPKFKKQIDAYFIKVHDLRNNWFKNSKEDNCKKLILLLTEKISFQDKLISLIDMYIKKEYLIKTPNSNYILSCDYPTIFKETKKSSLDSFEIFKETGFIIPVFPPSFSFLLPEYSRAKGPVSKFIRLNLFDKSKLLKPEFDTLAKKRIDFFNSHLIFCKKYSLGYGPIVSFNLHESPSSLKSKVLTPIKSIIKLKRIKKVLLLNYK